MRLLLFILGGLLLTSCIKDDESLDVNLSVQGVLRTNSVIQRVIVEELNPNGPNIKARDARVTITDGINSIELLEAEPGVYEYVGFDFDVEPLKTYYLEVNYQDQRATSSTTLPPPVEIVSQSTTSFGVDLDTNGEIVFATEWEFEEDYSQLVDLFNIDDNPNEIPFENPLEEFDDLYAFPIPASSLILKDLNFKYYGQYVLTINLISKDYESMFFINLENGQNDPPEGIDNIEGGEGFFTGVSQEQILIEILE